MNSLPRIDGRSIRLSVFPAPRVRRGKLSPGSREGEEVHAASSVRGREILLDRALFRDPLELKRILIHELFHFAWPRVGNAARREFDELLQAELRRRARGELGWSAEWRKEALRSDDPATGSRRWREYVCESFCDTAAWLLVGRRRHEEFTLGARHRERRRDWFRNFLKPGQRITL